MRAVPNTFAVCLLALCYGGCLVVPAARAEDPDETARRDILKMSAAKPPTLTRKQERTMLQALEDAKKQKPQEKGNATSDDGGLGGRSSVEEDPPGIKDTLQFQFLDSNGFPIDTPTIGSVLYEVNTDPASTVFSVIGTATDASTDFALDYILPGGELLIRAIPFDLGGNPFDFPDLNDPTINLAIGYIENIPMPEPSSALLAGLGLVMTAGVARRMTRPRA